MIRRGSINIILYGLTTYSLDFIFDAALIFFRVTFLVVSLGICSVNPHLSGSTTESACPGSSSLASTSLVIEHQWMVTCGFGLLAGFELFELVVTRRNFQS